MRFEEKKHIWDYLTFIDIEKAEREKLKFYRRRVKIIQSSILTVKKLRQPFKIDEEMLRRQ
jgi:hypothetical protein